MRLITLILPLLLISTSTAQAISLRAPGSVPAGADFRVTWSGDGDPRDFVTIVPVETKEGQYGHYQYAKSGTIDFTAPDEPGDYEIRYLAKVSPYETMARTGLLVTAVTATIKTPSAVDAGAEFSIEWTGPGHSKDFITIVEAGAKERTYGSYVYTRKGSPLALRAPDQPGDYEVRYLTGQKYYTLATSALTVGANDVSLEAAARIQAGGQVSVRWTGPDNAQDWIAIAGAGSPGKEYITYTYTSKGSPLVIRAPDEPGSYEIRYLTGQSYAQLAAIPLEVTVTAATLAAADEVRGGEPFTVEWTGPDHPRDYIGMTLAGGGKKPRHAAYTYTHMGNPVTMTAPFEPGEYELRYETGQSAKILARIPVRVTPPATRPGTLRVLSGSGKSTGLGLSEGDAVELILDASGSMLKKQDGRRRIDIAKDVLAGLVGNTVPAGTPFALRVFGHKEADSCRTDLEVPLQPLAVSEAVSVINAIEAMNLAKTPIGRSLDLVAQDLKSVTGERVVVLITDGEETCDGDPATAIENLKSAGMGVRVNIVGFAIDDADLKETFRYWASLGGGAYHDAAGAEDLGRSLTRALSAPYDVVNDSGDVVISGLVGGAPVLLTAGAYRVQARGGSTATAAAVVVGGEETMVTLEKE